MKWFDIPGPAHFITRVADDIRETTSVVATIPRCFPEDWIRALKNALDDIESMKCPEALAEFLKKLSNRVDGEPFVTPEELIESGQQPRVFILEYPSTKAWIHWKPFLLRFSNLNRSVPPLKRSVFLVITDGEIQLDESEVLLKGRWISDYIDHADSQLFAHANRHRLAKSSLTEQLHLYLRSELSLWDFALCEQLADVSLDELSDPEGKLLATIAGQRKWKDVCQTKFSHYGILFSLEKKPTYHSAYLAMTNRTPELRARIWRAQVRFLFPFLEEQRVLLLQELRKIMPVQIDHLEKKLADDQVLEFGAITDLMETSYKTPKHLQRYGRKLRKLRNRIAHSKVCRPRDIPTPSEILEADYANL